jgi:hypothetical protein
MTSPDAHLLVSPRRTYYNPILDLRTQDEKMTPEWRKSIAKYESGGPLNEPDEDHPYNLVSSLCLDGYHRPALDLDDYDNDGHGDTFDKIDEVWAFGARNGVLVPSSSSGHFHLYMPEPALTWREYVADLAALTRSKVIQGSYLLASIERGQTLLRPPHILKRAAR